MGKCSFGQLTDFGLANLKLFIRTNTIIKVSFYLSLQNTDVRIRLANVVTVHNEGVYNWHTIILPDWTLKKRALSNFAFQHC